jgi:hypothetical protein
MSFQAAMLHLKGKSLLVKIQVSYLVNHHLNSFVEQPEIVADEVRAAVDFLSTDCGHQPLLGVLSKSDGGSGSTERARRFALYAD